MYEILSRLQEIIVKQYLKLLRIIGHSFASENLKMGAPLIQDTKKMAGGGGQFIKEASSNTVYIKAI